MRALAVTVLAALVAAPSAGAWTKLSAGTLANTADPGVLLTQQGTELVVYGNSQAGTFSLVRNGAAPRVLVNGDPNAYEARLVQQPSGAIQLYFPGYFRIQRLTSTDDGQTWTGPVDTQASYISPVESAAVRADGTPLFSVDNTFGVYVFQGLNGELQRNVFAHCCGYAESLAVDSSGLAQVAFWSNANPPLANYVYEPLDAEASPGAPFVYSQGAQTLSNDARTPLVADRSGNTFAGRMEGYPTPNGFWVDTFRAGARVRSVRVWPEFQGQADKIALAVEPDGYLWAVWTAEGAVRAARSRSGGAHFGVSTHANLTGSAYQLEALARNGSVLAVVNDGASLQAQRLLPGLGVSLKKLAKKHWVATIVDDGFGVAGAKAVGAARTLHSNGAGRIDLKGLPEHAFFRVTHAGYVATGFRVP